MSEAFFAHQSITFGSSRIERVETADGFRAGKIHGYAELDYILAKNCCDARELRTKSEERIFGSALSC